MSPLERKCTLRRSQVRVEGTNLDGGRQLSPVAPRRKEIFYLAPDNKLMAATVTFDGARVDVGAARPLFDVRPAARWFYDVSPHGQFLVNMAHKEQAASAPITLVVNSASKA